ncbi:MAG: NAD(P)-dependent alcohol dehydrogenase [Bacteroidetes bacterium]|nr:MAG: NAD(P)-dependent alcohol dehydrogenase [Bacteroidota bacterium]
MQKIIYEKYGPAEVMEVTETSVPVPAPDEVLVKVMAAGINPVDYKVRNGSLKFLTGRKFPRTPGGEIAGTVEKNGSESSKFKKGENVFAMLSMAGGGYSEYICVKEELLSRMPEKWNFADAAVVPLAGLTALQSLRDKGKISPGMKVLINGGSGGVGMFGIQIARAMGAEVTAVCSGKNMELVKGFGAHHVIDYQKEDFTQLPEKFDIILDAVAMSSAGKCSRILKPGGTFVTTVPSPAVMLRQMTNPLRSRKTFGIMCKPGGKDLDVLADLMREGKIKPFVEKSYPLDQATIAHKHIETGRVRGKLVIKM